MYHAHMLPDRAETEVWFRNPGFYIRELAQVGCRNIVFDHGYVHKRRIDPAGYCSMNFGLNESWRCLVIDSMSRYAQMYETGKSRPTAVWPAWSASEDSISELVALIKKPWGESSRHLNEPDETLRPSEGQRHLVVITDLPSMLLGSSRTFMTDLSSFQEDHPEVTFFIHGIYSYSMMFGLSFKMVDVEARAAAAKGKIQLPYGGAPVFPADLRDNRYWMEILGHGYSDLKDPKERCKYNIKSAIFAGTYWKSLRKFAINRYGQRLGEEFWKTPAIEMHIKENSLVYTKRLVARPGDRVVCDDCSLWLSCKYFREGSVCAVPESDMQQVSQMFGTRDSHKIQQALAALVQANTERIERGMRAEATPIPGKDEESPSIERDVDPALTKLITDTFKMGDRLLQIVDPAFRPGSHAVNVNVGAGANRVEITSGSDDHQMVAHVVTMLEARGYSRDQITEDMVKMALAEIASDPQKAIEGTVVP